MSVMLEASAVVWAMVQRSQHQHPIFKVASRRAVYQGSEKSSEPDGGLQVPLGKLIPFQDVSAWGGTNSFCHTTSLRR